MVVDVEPDAAPTAQVVAIVTAHDAQILYAAPAGEYGSKERGEALDRLDALLADRRVVHKPNFTGPAARYPRALLRLLRQSIQPGADPRHPWAVRSTAHAQRRADLVGLVRPGRLPGQHDSQRAPDGWPASCAGSRTAPHRSGRGRPGRSTTTASRRTPLTCSLRWPGDLTSHNNPGAPASSRKQ
ncbi:hypothetical protein ACFCY8_33555 [Streptomyces noursei]|uniref:hypothetical protein n=1 Tax=Streptomyces noursei TaxID=1971 RepID=UPI0035E1190E